MKIQKINLCHQCGKCCETLAVISLDEQQWNNRLDRYNADPEKEAAFSTDMKFLVESCERLTKEEAIKRNPILQQWIDKAGRELVFFTCKNLKDNKCSIYQNRPAICSGFPFYSQDYTLLPLDFLLYDENCGFKALRVDMKDKSRRDFFCGVEDNRFEVLFKQSSDGSKGVQSADRSDNEPETSGTRLHDQPEAEAIAPCC
jgi:Fe-S-cluster containining protein